MRTPQANPLRSFRPSRPGSRAFSRTITDTLTDVIGLASLVILCGALLMWGTEPDLGATLDRAHTQHTSHTQATH